MGAPRVVVMGVAGSGKSTVGRLLAERLDCGYHDADDLHPPENVARMRAGVPLTDEDRWPWLDEVGRTLAREGGVMACSALKRSYRDVIRRHEPAAWFVHLDGSEEILRARLTERTDHFMPASLLTSQLDTLEPLGDDEGLVASIEWPPETVCALVLRSLPG